MALRFIESFTFCGSDFIDRWDGDGGANIDTNDGRTSPRCLVTNFYTQYTIKNLDSQATWIVGVATKITGGSSNTTYPSISLYDVGDLQMGVWFWTDGTIRVYRGTTLLETSTATWTSGVYQYFEFKTTIDNTVGSYEVRMDGAIILSGSNIDTQNSSNASADRVRFGGCVGFMDDIYICDGTGGAFDDFLGNVHVGSVVTDGSGNHSAWTASAGNDYQTIDDVGSSTLNHDSDATYVSTDGAADRSSFTYDNAAVGTTSIQAVQLTIAYRKDAVGAKSITPFIRIDGVDQDSAALTCADGYQIDTIPYEEQPDATAWNETDFNAMEVGVKEGS